MRATTTGDDARSGTVARVVLDAPRGTQPPADAGFTPYEAFVHAVGAEQLAEWLPDHPQRILDLSRGCPTLLELMIDRGHDVVHAGNPDVEPVKTGGRLHPVVADPRRIDWLAAGSVDRVVAEGSVLSTALATEITLDDVHRALRPGGRLLLVVDSLLAGLAWLAAQGRWAELADVPSADVFLLDGTDGEVLRCFWPEELDGMLRAAGFVVDWVRPRTVLTERMVSATLADDPTQLPMLIRTELRLAVERTGESLGNQLVASAVRP